MKRKQAKKLPKNRKKLIFNSKNKREKNIHKKLTDTVQKERERDGEVRKAAKLNLGTTQFIDTCQNWYFVRLKNTK